MLNVTVDELAPLPGTPLPRMYRQRLGLTQRQVADVIGIGYSSLNAIEHGEWWPQEAEAWAQSLGVTTTELRAAWENARLPEG